MSFEAPVLAKEPKVLIAGDTVKFTRFIQDASPDDGQLQYFFNSPVNNASVDPVVATDNGDGGFLITLLSALTDTMQVGEWKWEAHFFPTSDPDARYRVGFGRFRVKANYASLSGGTGVDDRTHVEITLDNIEAVIAKKATQDQLQYMIGNRSLMRMSFSELEKFRKDYKRQLAQQRESERIANGEKPRNQVKVMFGNGNTSSFPWWPGGSK
jgi:hypothetical protein